MRNDNILFQIKTLEKMIARYFLKQIEIEKLSKPTPTQMQIMDYFLDNNKKEIFQKDLEDILHLRRATVSGVLQTMEKNELIQRVTDEEDTRIKKIILNKKAKKIFKKNEEKMKELEKIVKEGISEKELEIFSNVIQKMKNNIENRMLETNKIRYYNKKERMGI